MRYWYNYQTGVWESEIFERAATYSERNEVAYLYEGSEPDYTPLDLLS